MSSTGGSAPYSSGPEESGPRGPRTVTLAKGGHRWAFSCAPGEEAELLRTVSELAGRGDVPFSWFDAALVGHQIARRLQSGLNRVEKSVDEV